MIKVKILSPIYVDGFAYRKNVEYQIDDEVVNILLQKGYCELIKEEQEEPSWHHSEECLHAWSLQFSLQKGFHYGKDDFHHSVSEEV